VKELLQHLGTALFVAVACQTVFALAEDSCPVSSDAEAASAADDQEAATIPACSFEDSLSQTPFVAETGRKRCVCVAKQACRTWTIDYRVRQLVNSNTSYEFGTSPATVPGWTPLSKLDWSLDSTWHGLQVGLEKPNWDIHFEWLTPIDQNISGSMADYDWINPPGNTVDSLTLSSLRWNDGQMLDLGGEFKLTSGPIEIWPLAGFRFQRFNMTASGIDYIVPPTGPSLQYQGVDVISFNQQYYQCYVGGQLRKSLCCRGTPVALTLEGDWAATWGYNVDHHLVRAGGDRYTMQNTSGDTFHFALTAEAPLSRRLNLGFQVDHMVIRTTGTHRMDWQSQGLNMTWTNGVLAKSSQTSLTAFLRARF